MMMMMIQPDIYFKFYCQIFGVGGNFWFLLGGKANSRIGGKLLELDVKQTAVSVCECLCRLFVFFTLVDSQLSFGLG
jgi:hypothetical protein